MNLILTCLQYEFEFDMNNNTDTESNIIGFVINSAKHIFGWWEIEKHYTINRNEP